MTLGITAGESWRWYTKGFVQMIALATGPQGAIGPAGPDGPTGPDGAPGHITSVVRTSGTGAPGTVDTYTITGSNGSTWTFNVTNGADGNVTSVNGIAGVAGDVSLGWTDIPDMIPTSKLPATALTIPTVVADQAAMLALDAQQGDVAIRSDNSAAYMLAADGDPTVLADWLQISAPGSVTSVNGQTGVIVLAASDVGALADTTTAGSIGGASSTQGAVEACYEPAATSGTFTLDCSLYSGMVLSGLTGAATVALSNVPSTVGKMNTFTVLIEQTATKQTITWPSGLTWLTTVPTDTASKATMVTIWRRGTSGTLYASGVTQP